MSKVTGADKARVAPGASAARTDTTKFEVVEPKGGAFPKTQVTWTSEGRAPVRFSLGAPGSKQITIEGKMTVDELLHHLVSSYSGAPGEYGTTDAADKYQDMIGRIAKTLGVTEGSLLTK